MRTETKDDPAGRPYLAKKLAVEAAWCVFRATIFAAVYFMIERAFKR